MTTTIGVHGTLSAAEPRPPLNRASSRKVIVQNRLTSLIFNYAN